MVGREMGGGGGRAGGCSSPPRRLPSVEKRLEGTRVHTCPMQGETRRVPHSLGGGERGSIQGAVASRLLLGRNFGLPQVRGVPRRVQATPGRGQPDLGAVLSGEGQRLRPGIPRPRRCQGARGCRQGMLDVSGWRVRGSERPPTLPNPGAGRPAYLSSCRLRASVSSFPRSSAAMVSGRRSRTGPGDAPARLHPQQPPAPPRPALRPH